MKNFQTTWKTKTFETFSALSDNFFPSPDGKLKFEWAFRDEQFNF